MRTLIVLAIFVGAALTAWAIAFWLNRAGQRYRDRTAMIKDENYLALEQSVNLLRRILEHDAMFPVLQTNQKNEAEEIIDSFDSRILRKGK